MRQPHDDTHFVVFPSAIATSTAFKQFELLQQTNSLDVPSPPRDEAAQRLS